jgi:hypothetical protein
LKKHPKGSVDFVRSIGNHPVSNSLLPVDDYMHQVMKSRNHYSIVAKKIKFRYERGFETSASHRLEDHKNVMTLLQYLAGIENPDYNLESLATRIQDVVIPKN